ncbi:MAG: hypothetical protein WCW36_01165 [Candidatus Paceibacterota bacterium]|jgi:hypothetical protein
MKSNTTSIIIVTLIVAAGAYWYFFVQTGNQPPLTVTSTSGNATQTKFQMLVSQLQPISFNTAIFSNPKFNALIDITTPISPEPSGRLDPFAPITGVTGQ